MTTKSNSEALYTVLRSGLPYNESNNGHFMVDMQEVILLAGSDYTRRALQAQLLEIVGDVASVRSYAVEEGYIPYFANGIVMASSGQLAKEVETSIAPECTLLVAERSINFHYIDQLFELADGTDVLVVNDSAENAERAIESLLSLRIDHLHYHAYYPGKVHYKRCAIAITPGEVGLVPTGVETVVNIGPRLLDVTSIISLLNALNFDLATQRLLSDRYLQKIIDLSKRLAKASRDAQQMSNHLKQVVDGVHDGILAINETGIITVLNGILETILDVSAERVVGRHIDDMISSPELLQFIHQQEGDATRLFSLSNADVIVHRIILQADSSRVFTFKNAGETVEMERKLRHDLVRKGHYAKYNFNDIVGHSGELEKTKRIAHKLAQSELTILIEGESGTGKELFASSIHNASPRQHGPFLAVNFSALPEDLVESELFGHDEGAFTGARKGGRKGLFEQAHGGTLFLDEIGDISLKVQARLLRVLQEKELLRVGGSEIIPVDVRVIAATNRNLLSLVEKNQFREDLYHRLKVLYLHLPPLRHRKEDIEELIRYTVHQSGHEPLVIDADVIETLEQYAWFGNIRELRNTLDYMLTVCENNRLTVHDIPESTFFQEVPIGLRAKTTMVENDALLSVVSHSPPSPIPTHELDQLLVLADQLEQREGRISRARLLAWVQQQNLPFTEQQIRLRLGLLEQRGYVKQFRGRAGTHITSEGRAYLQSLS